MSVWSHLLQSTTTKHGRHGHAHILHILHIRLQEKEDTAPAWKEFTAPDGRKYYYNKLTKESKWEMPAEMKAAQAAAGADKQADKPAAAGGASGTPAKAAAAAANGNTATSPAGASAPGSAGGGGVKRAGSEEPSQSERSYGTKVGKPPVFERRWVTWPDLLSL